MLSILSVILSLAMNPAAEAACKKSQYCAYENKVGGEGSCPKWACRDKKERGEVASEKQAAVDSLKAALDTGKREIANVKDKK